MGRDRWALIVPFTLPSLEPSWTDWGILGRGTEAMPIPYLGYPCLRVMATSQGVGPRLAWTWKVVAA